MRRVWAGVVAATMVAACGGGNLTLPEYAAEAERLVAAMEAGFESIDADWESGAATVDRARSYWDRRMEIRVEFLEGVRALDPPDDVADLHDTAIDIFTRMTDADRARAARVDTFETMTSHWDWVDTPEGRASDAVLQEVFAFCSTSQSEFDETRARESFEDVPWIPSEMQEVVKVAFGCPPS